MRNWSLEKQFLVMGIIFAFYGILASILGIQDKFSKNLLFFGIFFIFVSFAHGVSKKDIKKHYRTIIVLFFVAIYILLLIFGVLEL